MTDAVKLHDAVQSASVASPLSGIVYAVGSIPLKPLKSTSAKDFIDAYTLNFLGAAIALKAAAPALAANQAPGSGAYVIRAYKSRPQIRAWRRAEPGCHRNGPGRVRGSNAAVIGPKSAVSYLHASATIITCDAFASSIAPPLPLQPSSFLQSPLPSAFPTTLP